MTTNRLYKFMRFATLTVVILFSINIHAQTARAILDKTALLVDRKGGASANFSISSTSVGSTRGTIAIKGNKFLAKTQEVNVWFDGKTQWTHMKKTDEVNITHPSSSQQVSMNPYTFISMYKTGYNLSKKTLKNSFQIHMIAKNAKNKFPEMYILINKINYLPSQVKFRQVTNWVTVNITNFKPLNQPDHLFVFKPSDAPNAEIIDLR